MWGTPKNVLKALRMEEPPEMNASRKNCIMEHTMVLAMLLIFLVLFSVGGALWLQNVPLALLAAAITMLTVLAVYRAQTSAYYLGKYHGMVAAYAHSQEIEELVPQKTDLAAEKKDEIPTAAAAETEAGAGAAEAKDAGEKAWPPPERGGEAGTEDPK